MPRRILIIIIDNKSIYIWNIFQKNKNLLFSFFIGITTKVISAKNIRVVGTCKNSVTNYNLGQPKSSPNPNFVGLVLRDMLLCFLCVWLDESVPLSTSALLLLLNLLFCFLGRFPWMMCTMATSA